MLRWRNETQAPVPVHISELAEAMAQDIWIKANTYDITYADEDSGTTEKTINHLQAWAVNVERKKSQPISKSTCWRLARKVLVILCAKRKLSAIGNLKKN